MKKNKSIAILIFLLLISFATAFAKPRRQSRLAQGAWGGQHVTIEVNESSATVEFDCAHGQIEGPLVTDRRGRFNLKGTFEGEHGGPVRIDEKSSSQPARYSGWTDGHRMTLTVT